MKTAPAKKRAQHRLTEKASVDELRLMIRESIREIAPQKPKSNKKSLTEHALRKLIEQAVQQATGRTQPPPIPAAARKAPAPGPNATPKKASNPNASMADVKQGMQDTANAEQAQMKLSGALEHNLRQTKNLAADYRQLLKAPGLSDDAKNQVTAAIQQLQAAANSIFRNSISLKPVGSKPKSLQ